MKHEYKKHEKEFYQPKTNPQILTVPKQKYICIKGKGNPNHDDFKDRIQVLYSLAYTIKMMPRKGYIPEGYFDYTVYPLEGLWDLSEKGRQSKTLLKEELLYTIMIRQPYFVTNEVFNKALELVKIKKPSPLLEEVYFDTIEDGLSCQILHIGSYDDEVYSFNKMKAYIKENHYNIKTLIHREIYLSDARRVTPEKFKTILRYQIKKEEK